MVDAVKGQVLARKILEALGVDPKGVCRVTVVCEPTDMARVHVEFLAPEALLGVFEPLDRTGRE